jgi:lipopolysaccharide transport protein LptA
MARPTARRTVTRFRVVLMLAFVAAVSVVVALYLFGAAGAPRARRGGSAPPAFEEGTRMVGKDFDYTFSQGDKAVFRVRGNSIRVDKDDTVYLDNVGLTLYDKEGRQFDAESEQASINRTTNEGRMWGDVAVKGPSQLEIHSNQLLIQEKGNLLATPGVTRILYAGKYFARCDALQAWLPDEVYSLLGKVRIETFPEVQPPLRLEAGRAVYERKRRQLRVEEGAELQRGPATLDADRISGLLSQDETSLTFVRALYNVSGETAEKAAPGTTKVSWEGNDLAVGLAPQGNQVRRVAIEGLPGKPASLHSVAGAVKRDLVAPHIEGVLAESQLLRSAEAYGGVDIQETGPPPAAAAGSAAAAPGAAGSAAPATGAAPPPPPQPTVRHAHGQRGDATFRTDGQIAGVTLLEQVTYGDGEVNATGDRATMDMDAGRGEFFGNPVDVVSPRGRMRAPHVLYTSADQLVHAVEGVHAVIEQANDANLAGTVLGEGKGPVMVESAEAFWRRPQSSFVFRGDVRAWRGDNILLTPELRGVRLAQGDELAATSGVKTVWIPGQGEGAAPAAASSAAAGGGAAGGGARAGAGGGAGPPAPKRAPAGGAPAGAGASKAAGGKKAGTAGTAAGAAPPAKGARAAAAGAGAAAGAAATGTGTKAAAGTGTKAAAGAGSPPAGQGGGGPITVLASDMLYRDGSGLLTYSGNVHVDQDGKTLSCKQLDVQLDQDHKAKQMNCTGQTHLDDPSTGRKIDGETGIYRLETRKIDILGDPVVMHDRDGNLVHGKRLRYALDSGKVEVLGKDDGPPAPKPANPVPGTPAAAQATAPGSPESAPVPAVPAVPAGPAAGTGPLSRPGPPAAGGARGGARAGGRDGG